jgi:hypothetical protein
MYFYIIKMELINDYTYFKIGISDEPYLEVKEIVRTNPLDMTLHYHTQVGNEITANRFLRGVMQLLIQYNHKDMWYRIRTDMFESIVDRCKQFLQQFQISLLQEIKQAATRRQKGSIDIR